MVMQNEKRLRAVILTAIEVECRAVCAGLTEIEQIVHPQNTIYEQGSFYGSGNQWSIAVAQIGAGNTGVSAEVERAISYFTPDVILFVGIAGGLKDVKIGDVVAATKVYGYESGKANEEFMCRPDVLVTDYGLQQRSMAEIRNDRWLDRVENTTTTSPKAYIGPIAAGEKVIADTRSSVYKFLKVHYGDALAVEMEGKGFLEGCIRNSCPSMVIRGISDLLDHKSESDSAGNQEVAAYHASCFAFELLSAYGKTKPTRRLFELIIKGRYEEFTSTDVLKIVGELQTLLHDSELKVLAVTKGSIHLRIECSHEAYMFLEQMHINGVLLKIGGYEIVSIRAISYQDLDLQRSQSNTAEKWQNPFVSFTKKVAEEVEKRKDIFTTKFAHGRSVTGRVKWFNNAKGYGFLATDEGKDVFVHYTSIQSDGYHGLREGQAVEFEVVESPSGPMAADVKPV